MKDLIFTKRETETISEFMQFYSTEPVDSVYTKKEDAAEYLNRFYWDDIMPVIKACNECTKDGKLDTAYEYALENLDPAIYGDDIKGAWRAIFPFMEYAVSLKINVN